MPRLIWSPPALLDVQRLYRFLADRNKDAAQRAVKAIRAGVKILAAHPEAGRPAESMEPEYREWLIGFGGSGYVALYRYDGETALIVAVRHQRESTNPETLSEH
ncbi:MULTISPECIES: type II toxin-antitoxin system RelE/ParE family toxin [Acidithiobacillus]|uniref:Type II toxin-antitoxin system RelE/ParE family toxin n=1 Tax=Acidithiobacillus montserratensis TaxID=2729135 RepID=A0ACD5HHH3_9PROT|nr:MULTISPECIES: type II toxin-antitoxin system RelE/ParE family toxin [Acidithiobacillus]MBE7567504.1 type II toxin-antitoxin system RelE/ParE family toxin [Acidithiobacillus sp. HP-11]MBU2742775.1 type II toxin-antitoxin system RelE/ParE family toxin [Acidithiobacillus albertensis]MBU2748517.1 type II toxin-antitoxin system RelE/ParE family toxin [Acidithiobacillus montserratensis]MBU2793342.1 type II toxin-antitoxin system RelE/ParE family toxin [Acidithiobacillus thiooxidans]